MKTRLIITLLILGGSVVATRAASAEPDASSTQPAPAQLAPTRVLAVANNGAPRTAETVTDGFAAFRASDPTGAKPSHPDPTAITRGKALKDSMPAFLSESADGTFCIIAQATETVPGGSACAPAKGVSAEPPMLISAGPDGETRLYAAMPDGLQSLSVTTTDGETTVVRPQNNIATAMLGKTAVTRIARITLNWD